MTAVPTEAPDDTGFAPTAPEPPPEIDVDIDGVAGEDDEGRPVDQLPTIGHVGRYALKYTLGEGGLGTVHAALDPLLSRAIAVKTLHLQLPAHERESLAPQLLHEARAAAGLSHPYIVTVYDAGLAPEGVYIAMERLQGRDLRHLLADGWRPTPAQAALIVRRVADALAYAHSRGVIHCDVKPANIFMVDRNRPKVLDFGIARVALADLPSGPALVAGSPYYMAPEQLRGEAVDARCDVYALGVVLHELLAGQRAFAGDTLEAIRQAVLQGGVAPVHQVHPDVPPALSQIAATAMALQPAARYRSARQLSRALRQALGERTAEPAPARSRRAGLLLSAGAVSLLAGGLLWPPGAAEAPSGAATDLATALPAPSPAPSAKPLAVSAPAVAPTTAGADPVPSGAAPKSALRSAARTATSPNPPRSVADVRSRTEASAPPVAAVAATGMLHIAVSPWGQVEIDGAPAGTTPPLNQLALSAGKHTVVIRNEDFPPFKATVTVSGERPVTVKHRFGS
jgi:serine/threonine-protein kinase